jgi:Glyoxalase/Bleomycin resistance protein/Dioxygenase superfamily
VICPAPDVKRICIDAQGASRLGNGLIRLDGEFYCTLRECGRITSHRRFTQRPHLSELARALVSVCPVEYSHINTYVPEQDKRWVIVAPPGASESRLLLARAVGEEQTARIGNQTGGHVFLFLHTDDFWRDFHAYKAKGIVFIREPKEESYGTVAVFKDLYGNLWARSSLSTISWSLISVPSLLVDRNGRVQGGLWHSLRAGAKPKPVARRTASARADCVAGER